MKYEFTVEFASGQTETSQMYGSQTELDEEVRFLMREKNGLHKAGEDYIVDFSYKQIEEE